MRVKVAVSDEDKIREIGEMVRRGGVIVYPTDTVYGIGGDPFKEDVVKRVFQIKRRGEKEMPLLVSSLEKAEELAEFDEGTLRLAYAFWPGPLTLVLKSRVRFPKDLTAGKETIGLRIPRHDLTLKIIKAAGGVIIGTSANISGRSPPRSVEEIDPTVEGEVDLVVDGGRAERGVPSTVVELATGSGGASTIRVIREGAIKEEELISVMRGRGK